jgi:predicted ATPase
MITRFYVHNYRCLENFELPVGQHASSLLFGRNGSGKSTISHAFTLLQSIARGTNRVGKLVQLRDFSRGRADSPMRFEIEATLEGRRYRYHLAFEFPQGFKEPRVLTEQLHCDGQPQYERDRSQVVLSTDRGQAFFLVDWFLVALSIVQERSETDPIAVFKRWLARMLILAPEPGHMSGESTGASLEPERTLSNFGEWFTGLLAHSPEAYTLVVDYLKDVIPDLQSIKNPLVSSESRSLSVQFQSEQAGLSLSFSSLSDGEKCFFVAALVLASTATIGPLFCFWDEPESHLSIAEVRHFVMALRQGFGSSGQLVVTSHSAEAIRAFSAENSFVLSRRSHLEPTQIQRLDTIQRGPGDLINALILGEIG